MKYAIVGSLDWGDEFLVRKFVRLLPRDSTVISGGASGPDSFAVDEASKIGLETIVYLADWKLHGKSAGYKRNILIVNSCDKLIAFWDGMSKGTKHSIDLAKKQDKIQQIFLPKGMETL